MPGGLAVHLAAHAGLEPVGLFLGQNGVRHSLGCCIRVGFFQRCQNIRLVIGASDERQGRRGQNQREYFRFHNPISLGILLSSVNS